MKWYLTTILCLLVLLSGCASQGVGTQASTADIPTNNIYNPKNQDRSNTSLDAANDPADSYLNEYRPWQLAKANEMGVSESDLRQNVTLSLGQLKSRIKDGLYVPPQSSVDNLMIDAYLRASDGYMNLQGETAVLLTEKRGDIYYSFLTSATIEYGGDVVVIWEKNDEHILIIDRIAIEVLSSIAVNPSIAEPAGERIMASALGTLQWYGDGPAVSVQCGIFSVTMKDGTVITKDVKGQSCFILFLPDDEVVLWSLKDTDGELIWDSEESLWQG